MKQYPLEHLHVREKDIIKTEKDIIEKGPKEQGSWLLFPDSFRQNDTDDLETDTDDLKTCTNDPETPRKRSMMAIKAQMGLGKTERLIADLQHIAPDTSILVITHSRVFSNKMKAELESMDFKCYLDAERGEISDPRVVCCLDSCPRLRLPSANGYDIVIIDELLSVLARANSHFMPHDEVYACLDHILRVSDNLVFMDAYVDNMFCYQFIKYLSRVRGEECQWIHNAYVNKSNRVCQLNVNRQSKLSPGHKREAIRQIIAALEAGKKVVVPSSSKTFVKDLMAQVEKINSINGTCDEDGTGGESQRPKYKVACYTADTPPEEMAKAIKDPHEAWRDLDLLAYSPTITSGISFKEAHFDCLFGYMENSARMPLIDACLQQIFRVRSLADAPEGGHNMKVFINDTRNDVKSESNTKWPLSLSTIESDLDSKILHKLGAFQEGKWEVPEYLSETENGGDLPAVPTIRRAGELFPVYDKERLSYIMLIGMVYLRNKSACYYTDLVTHTLRSDYGIDTTMTDYKEQEDSEDNSDISRTTKDNLYKMPFCQKLVVPDRENEDKIKKAIYRPEEKTKVEIPILGDNNKVVGQYYLTVPCTVLQRTQLFTYKITKKYYKIRYTVDQRFFDTFIKDASTQSGQQEAISQFFDWKKFCRGVRMTIEENRGDYAAWLLDIGKSKDRNFKMYHGTNTDKYYQMIIFGQELLIALCGSYENTKALDIGDHQYILLREAFKDRMDAYMTQMTEMKYKAIIDLFEFHSTRHSSKKDLIASKQGVSHFVKKVLYDAFHIDFTDHGSKKKCIDATIWKTLKEYEVDYEEWIDI